MTMTIGPRIIKTGLAVMLALYICIILGLEPAAFAGVAATLTVQPSIYRTWRQMLDQVLTNTIGAAIALFSIFYLGDSPIIIGIVIMIVISVSLKLKMENTIPLTLVTVLAIMSASGNEDILFTLNRFLTILIGIGSAMIINIVILPPKYKKAYIKNVNSTFQKLSLLLRTVISNEMTKTTFEEEKKSLKKDLEKLEGQFKVFDEERGKIGKLNQTNAREVVIFKQMLKTLQQGELLLENIEEHYFQSKTKEEEDKLFDSHIEELIKSHEFILLKYEGKMKEHDHGMNEIIEESGEFFERVHQIYSQDKDQKLRLMIITSSVVDYTFQLHRLNKLIRKT
ncbi:MULTISPECIES: FUSC family protein [Sutcliffiella]|nr:MULTISPECIES: aromatic acid exporter family protein [Sutcliffiella]MED4017968.1 aromatic acid exporter family protein [Sutcliffiella cohnii]WBL16533.1 aromatic acid exporter family protein [Sutcliffiella sp. NC1]